MMEAPLFVKIDEYKEALDTISLIKSKLKEAKLILDKINEIKAKEDSEIEAWNNAIKEVEKKIEEIDSNLFEPETL